MSVSEKVLDAIELLTNASLQKANYDKTIQGQIISCEDSITGKYKCRYQDSVFYAYSNNPDVTYNKGTYIYILVPNNDMNKEKTILGTTKKLGVNYISQVQEDELYNKIGNSCIKSDNVYYLNTDNKDYKYTIYSYDGENNEVDLDIESLTQYFKQAAALIIGATFRTTITADKITPESGHYGIIYNLRFKDNSSNGQVIRSYILSENDMNDNPYKLMYDTRQYKIFDDFDGANFIRVESIDIFNKDFFNAEGTATGKLENGDIIISKLQLMGATRMSDNQINGLAISFYTPQGSFFSASSVAGDYKTITAQVRLKGSLITSAAGALSFYWGIENAGVSTSHLYYNRLLGRGWKCLNDSNIIQSTEDDKPSAVDWIPGTDTLIFNFEDATARNNKIKVAVLYNGIVTSKEITIQNLALEIPQLTIESSNGTKFYYDIGSPTLTCKINGAQQINYHYYWGFENNKGEFESLEETTTINEAYNNAIQQLQSLKTKINAGEKFLNAEQEHLIELQNNVAQYQYIQRVQNNKIYNVRIANIVNFGTFKCSIFNDKDIYLGTASLTLTNSLKNDDNGYSLIINNGNIVFQYDQNGNSPTSNFVTTPQTIQALSFSIYDNYGNLIDDEITHNLSNSDIRWSIPIKNTLLIDSKQNGESSNIDATLTYKHYDNLINLIYSISNKYDITKQLNQIKLSVNYKGIPLTAQTNFTFTKQGEPGTNGTQYTVKLVPNTTMESPPAYPLLTYVFQKHFMLNYTLGASDSQIIELNNIQSIKKMLKAQLWRNGELIWEGFALNDENINQIHPDLIEWSVLKNKYSSSTFDDSVFNIDSLNGTLSITKNLNDFMSAVESSQANIIKCAIKYNNKTYYGTLPISIGWVYKEDYKIGLKEQSGFRYVMYASDGTSPKYNNTLPFEFTILEKINDVWEDVSNCQGDHKISYEYKTFGKVKQQQKKLLTILTNSIYTDDLKPNQKRCRPIEKYDGQCVNIGLGCIYKNNNNNKIAAINIPIHFLLNKYGFSNLNDWDGNSIQLDNNGGYLLSPQLGAGTKNNDNTFTGVIMGQVKSPDKTESNIGIFGYNNGNRSFFLNSENGSALFGTGQGQIAIDPTNNIAMLYSGNYWNNYDSKTGLPINYNNGNKSGQGLLIDLTTPKIEYGNGNFSVDEKGTLIAKGNGSEIAGWKIQSNELKSFNNTISLAAQTKNTQGNITSQGKIYSNEHNTLTSTSAGFYLSKDGLSIGSLFKVDENGIVRIGKGAVDEKNKNHWVINTSTYKDNNNNTITNSYIAYGASGNDTKFNQANSSSSAASKVYIGTDGLSIGNKFSVDNKGNLIAYTGNIGGWRITNKGLQYSNSNGTEQITLGSDGSITGGTASNSKWTISANGKATFNNIDVPGISTIGGWQVSGNTLQSINRKLILDSSGNGSIRGNGWTLNGLTNNGTGSIIISNGGSLSLSGTGTLSAGGSSFGNGGTVLPALQTYVGGQTLSGYVGDIVANSIKTPNFTLGDTPVYWKKQTIVTGIVFPLATTKIGSWDVVVLDNETGSSATGNKHTKMTVYYGNVWVLSN